MADMFFKKDIFQSTLCWLFLTSPSLPLSISQPATYPAGEEGADKVI